jgi:glycosyltransferase involved in cell wall biosynthesis
MKIAIVYSTFYVKGGAENVIVWLTAELLQRGHQVTIFTSEYDRQDPDIPDVVKKCMVEISAGGDFSTWLDWLWAGRRLRKRLQAFDIVNPHNFPANVWVYFAKHRSPAFPPIIWYCQEPSRLLYPHGRANQFPDGRTRSGDQRFLAKVRREHWRIAGKLLQKMVFYSLTLFFRQTLHDKHRDLDQKAGAACDLILGNSDYMTARIQDIYQGKGMTCRLGVPVASLETLGGRPSPRPGSPAEKKSYFLTVSRLEPLKHVDEIIRAVHVLEQQDPETDASLVIVGCGSQEHLLRDLVEKLKLEARVVFAGRVTDLELARYYREALAVVYVPEDEAFGLVPLEAMRHETAVIVTKEGGMAETVVGDVTGLLVEPRRVDQLAAAMGSLLRDCARAIAMGRQGQRHVMAHFTFSRFVDRFVRHVELALERKAGT